MKKKVLAVFMAVFVTVGTVLAPAETGSVYAGQITEEQFNEMLINNDYTLEQLEEIRLGLVGGLSYQDILTYFKSDKSAGQMREIREQLTGHQES